MNANWIFRKQLLLLLAGLSLLWTACEQRAPQPEQSGNGRDTLSLLNLKEGQIPAEGHPLTKAVQKTVNASFSLPGRVIPDPELSYKISLLTSGRIGRVYIHRELERVQKGQLLFEYYSQEWNQVQAEYLQVLEGTPEEKALVRQKMKLLGIPEQSIRELEKTQKLNNYIPIYSPASGYIKWPGSFVSASESSTPTPSTSGEGMNMGGGSAPMSASSTPSGNATEQSGGTMLTPGMEVSKGVTLLEVIGEGAPLLSIGIQQPTSITVGTTVMMQDGTALKVEKLIAGNGVFSEAYVRLPAQQRYFIGELLSVNLQVKATGWWLPRTAVLSLGNEQVILKREGNLLRPYPVKTGVITDSLIQVHTPLPPGDIATNAWFVLEEDQSLHP